MNGKIRDGSMLRIAPLPNTNRKMTARLPVQNAIGNPSISSSASEPNSRIVSQPMPISRPTYASLRVTIMMSLMSFEMPCSVISAAPIGIINLTGQYWMPHSVNDRSPTEIASEANRYEVTSIVTMKMKKNSDVMMSAIALPRVENFV